MKSLQVLLAASLITVAAGCSGGGGGSIAPVLPPAPTTATVTFDIPVQDAPANTQYVTVQVNGGAAQSFGVVNAEFTAIVSAPLATDTFVLDAYSGSGALLATQTTTEIITKSFSTVAGFGQPI